MKKVEANRYPHSATLFKFCKEALEIRYEGNVKVIDQDVGAILGYDPADCSHWKKGKKNIRALATLKSIADHLNIDERLLIDIASGKVGLEEAVFEYRGYGDTSLSGRHLEALKKEFFKNPTKWQKDSNLASFEELFDINRQAVIELADRILDAGNFTEAPIYIPEIYQLYPGIKLISDPEIDQPVISRQVTEGDATVTEVRFRGPEMRPYIRYILGKEFFKFLVRSGNPIASNFANSPEEVIDIQANIFAGVLMIPAKMLRNEVEKVDSSFDLVIQLADTFWVSKSLMNQRLRDFLENNG